MPNIQSQILNNPSQIPDFFGFFRASNTFNMMNGLTIRDGTKEEDRVSFRNVRRGEPWVVWAKNEHPCATI